MPKKNKKIKKPYVLITKKQLQLILCDWVVSNTYCDCETGYSCAWCIATILLGRNPNYDHCYGEKGYALYRKGIKK